MCNCNKYFIVHHNSVACLQNAVIHLKHLINASKLKKPLQLFLLFPNNEIGKVKKRAFYFFPELYFTNVNLNGKVLSLCEPFWLKCLDDFSHVQIYIFF